MAIFCISKLIYYKSFIQNVIHMLMNDTIKNSGLLSNNIPEADRCDNCYLCDRIKRFNS